MRRRQFASLLGGTALLPVGAWPACAAAPGSCGVPIARNDGWAVVSLEDDTLVDRGGQYIRNVPELDLVVAVTAGYYQDYSVQASRTQFGVFRDVVRAAISARS
ncbi:MAG: hypothetical protein ABI330_08350 [Caldimonas sp.]